MTTQYKLEDNIPMPGGRFPLPDMEVGQSFILTQTNLTGLRRSISVLQKNTPRKYSVLRVPGANGGEYRCWRVK